MTCTLVDLIIAAASSAVTALAVSFWLNRRLR